MRTVRSAWDTRGWAGVSAHEMLSDEVAKDLEQLALKQDAKGENLSPYDEDEDGDNEIGITIAHQPAQPAVLLRKTSVFA